MCGRVKGRADGQLALLDALVFFAVAVVVSSVLLSYDRSDGKPELSSGSGTSNPGEILKAFLDASIGDEIPIQFGASLTVHQDKQVSVCLALEIEAILDGIGSGLFQALDRAYMTILERITNPVFQPYLVVLDDEGSTYVPILNLPCAVPGCGVSMASSMVLPCGGHRCLVEVVLSAQAFPNPVNV